jgi:phenylpropionate dioxygenase-like ring-hydroxylating dioxygenase large terminal subunit
MAEREIAELDAALERLRLLAEGGLEQATAMPPAIYRNPEFHELERREIFACDWHCVGLAADLPEAGHYLSFSINDQPVFVMRGRDGVIRGFSNVCLHRMMRLVEGQGSCQRLVCPYHAWTYDLDGQLLGAPHMKQTPGFEPRAHRLPAIRTEIWQGWIYVTLNDGALPVAALLASLAPMVAPYEMEHYIPVALQDHVWNTNWKLLTENFMEGYHLPVAHRATVGAWFPVGDTRFPPERHDGFTIQTFTKDETARYGRAHPSNTRLEGHERHTTVMPSVFPAHMYVLAPDHLWYLSLRPKSIGEVHVRFGVALAPEVVANMPDLEKEKAELLDFFDKVNAEDRFVVEGLYQGVQAPLARPGRLSWLEREIHDFTCYLANRLAGWRRHEEAAPRQRAVVS